MILDLPKPRHGAALIGTNRQWRATALARCRARDRTRRVAAIIRYTGTMDDVSNIRKARLWCAVGFTSYWAWLFLLLIAQVFGTPQQTPIKNVWLWCTIAHIAALIVLGLLARRLSPYCDNTVVAAGSPSIMAAGTGLLFAGIGMDSAFLILFALVFVGAGTAGMVLCWGEVLAALSPGGEQRTLLLSCLMASIAVYLILAYLPVEAFYVVLFAMPAVAAVPPRICTRILGPQLLAKETDEEEPEKLTSRFVLFCLIYSVPLGFFQVKYTMSGGGLVDWVPVLVPSFLILAVIGAADSQLERRHGFNFIPAIVIPGAIAGLLLLATFNDGNARPAGVLIFSTQQLLTVVLYARFAAMASRGKNNPAAVFALGVGATDAGFVIGMLAGETASRGTWPLDLTLGIVYVVVLGGFLATGLFQRKASGSEELAQPVTGIDEPGDFKRELTAIAEEHGLTAREEEVLGHLLRGKSISAVAADLFLSKNTVRSHVAHIYQKMDVHTRDELIELVDAR